MPRYKRSKPKTTSRASFSPVIYWTQEGARNANKFLKYGDRLERGRRLVLVMAAEMLVEEIQSKAPDIDGYEYANDLEVMILYSGDGEWTEGVTITHPGQSRELTDDESDTVLFISPAPRSPAYVSVLQKYGPWPAPLMPVKLEPGQARVVSRRVSPSEAAYFTRNIEGKKRRIEDDLRRSGLQDASITQDNQGSGTIVYSDLGFEVLRYEFGIHQKQIRHWEPALRSLQIRMRDLGKKFVDFVSTGNEGVFSVARHDKVSLRALSDIQRFQDLVVRKSGL